MLTADQSIGGQHPSEKIEAIRVDDLHAFYGESHALHGIDFTVYQGELVTLLGRNGAGRTTTLRALVGLMGRVTGSIVINGQQVVGVPPHAIAHLGVGYCPEERGIFASLNVEENLMLPPRVAPGGLTVEEILRDLPEPQGTPEEPGHKAVRGEQQMLAMARILRTGASILLLDEITEGLAPVIIEKLADVLAMLKTRGYTIVLVEQNFRFAAPLADRHLIMDHGHIAATVARDELEAKQAIFDEYLTV